MPTRIEIDQETLEAIEKRFHALIRARAEEFRLQVTSLPTLTDVVPDPVGGRARHWFAVSGMYGGFAYRLVREHGEAKLITESWSRVVGGSGQRHEITADRTTLLEVGFV